MSAREHREHPDLPSRSVSPFSVVAIATSLGGLRALSVILSGLDADFPSAILIAQHLGPEEPSLLVNILSRHTGLPVKWAEPGEPLQAGTVYVAPPNGHTRVTSNQTVNVTRGERIRFFRPSADILFESVALHFPERAIGMVLTGDLDDGARGLAAIAVSGGTTIAQSPQTCVCANMPRAAIGTGAVDYVLPLAGIATALNILTMQ